MECLGLPHEECLSLEQATTRNLVEPDLLKDMLRIYQDCSVRNLTKDGKFDPETGLVVDPSSGNSMSLQSTLKEMD